MANNAGQINLIDFGDDEQYTMNPVHHAREENIYAVDLISDNSVGLVGNNDEDGTNNCSLLPQGPSKESGENSSGDGILIIDVSTNDQIIEVADDLIQCVRPQKFHRYRGRRVVPAYLKKSVVSSRVSSKFRSNQPYYNLVESNMNHKSTVDKSTSGSRALATIRNFSKRLASSFTSGSSKKTQSCQKQN